MGLEVSRFQKLTVTADVGTNHCYFFILFQRFKGLGEMNPEQLWDTTMNPRTRLLNKVLIDDVVKADEVFDKLMGSEVEHRKQFISERAHEAEVDI